MTTKTELEQALQAIQDANAGLVALVEERDGEIAALNDRYAVDMAAAANALNEWKELTNAERKKVQQIQVKLDEADNRFRNLNSSLGKSQEMDTAEACAEAAAEVAETKRKEQLLISYLGNHGLLQDGVPAQEIAMQVIETLLAKVADLEAEKENA